MRELKFRYWNPYANKLVYNPKVFKEGWTLDQYFSDRGWTWEQYTGLKDKNGKEIYEGDIVKGGWLYGKDEHIVKYVIYGFYPFTVTYFDGDPMILDVDVEVIGNIHENPELLEEEE